MDTVIARERLEEMRGQIDRSILVLQGEHPSGRASNDSPQDPADAGTTLSETDRTEAALLAVQSQRRLVMDALVRIDRGVYGMCADCGKPIPEGRLDARPEAARCVGCQSKRDRRHCPRARTPPGGSGRSLPRASGPGPVTEERGRRPAGFRGVAPPG